MVVSKFDNDQKIPFKLSKLYLPVAILVISLIIVEIWVSHSLVIYGEQFKNIESLQASLSSENQLLGNQIDQLSALTDIASSSGVLGMEPPKDIKYIR